MGEVPGDLARLVDDFRVASRPQDLSGKTPESRPVPDVEYPQILRGPLEARIPDNRGVRLDDFSQRGDMRFQGSTVGSPEP
jgi:hypothetical protein